MKVSGKQNNEIRTKQKIYKNLLYLIIEGKIPFRSKVSMKRTHIYMGISYITLYYKIINRDNIKSLKVFNYHIS